MDPVSLCVCGSTGSIGVQTLDIVRDNPGVFTVASLTAHNNAKKLAEQIVEFRPALVCVASESVKEELLRLLPAGHGTTCLVGETGLREIAGSNYDIMLLAILGFAALVPLEVALSLDRAIAIANKESLVAAGDLIHRVRAQSSAPFIPVDSEHNSIYQCLQARPAERPEHVSITASGGPFLGMTAGELRDVTPDMAVRHPNWSMGAKISVDSATLMNKGLEVIEAAVLFKLKPHEIGALIQRESVVHALVDFEDGSTHAVLYPPSMKVPIAHALRECSARLRGVHPSLKVPGHRVRNQMPCTLHFAEPDIETFRCYALAVAAMEQGGAAPLILNAANELAVEYFLQEKISFLDIPALISHALEAVQGPQAFESFEEICTFHHGTTAKLREIDTHFRRYAIV